MVEFVADFVVDIVVIVEAAGVNVGVGDGKTEFGLVDADFVVEDDRSFFFIDNIRYCISPSNESFEYARRDLVVVLLFGWVVGLVEVNVVVVDVVVGTKVLDVIVVEKVEVRYSINLLNDSFANNVVAVVVNVTAVVDIVGVVVGVTIVVDVVVDMVGKIIFLVVVVNVDVPSLLTPNIYSNKSFNASFETKLDAFESEFSESSIEFKYCVTFCLI